MKIEKLPSGNYRVRVIIGHDENGKPIRKSFTHADKTKLRRIAAEYADEHRNVTTRQTVGSAMTAFLDAKEPVLSPSTLRAYTSLAKTLRSEHGRFCALSVASVGQKELQTLINARVKAGNSPKTVSNYHGFLSAVFKYAGFNLPPVTLPQQVKPNITIPEEAAVKRFMENAKDRNLDVALTLALFGMRRSEICALTLDDLDGEWLHVCKALVYGADNKLHIKYTKNSTSDRYIRIPAETADRIRELGYITDRTPEGISKAFNRLLIRSGVPHQRLHDLRHFFVSYCHNILHMSDMQIQNITGHKNEKVLRGNYLHSMDDKEVAEMVSDSMLDLIK